MPTPDEHPTVVLCDWAELVGGKLYIMGAGWSRILADTPANLAVAVLWHVPWEQANRPLNIQIRFKNEDGGDLLDPGGDPVVISGVMEVGRPAGVKLGSSLEAPMAFKLAGLSFPPGGYVVEFAVNDSVEASTRFDATKGI